MNKVIKAQLPDGEQVHIGYTRNDIKTISEKVPGCINSGYRTGGKPDLFTMSDVTHINQPWALPTYKSNTTYGSITASTGGNAYVIFDKGAASYTPGTNWNGVVTFYWDTPDILNLTGFDYRTATWSHSSYSTSYAKFYGYNYETENWELMGERYTSGSGDYTDTYYTTLKFMPTNKFKIEVKFNGGANLPSRLHDITPYGFKYVEAPAGSIFFKVDDGTAYKPLTATFFDVEEVTITSLSSVDTRDLPDGNYNCYLDKKGVISIYTNTHMVSYTAPESPVENDVWINTEEMKSYKFNAEVWEEFNQIRLGFFTMNQNALTQYMTLPYQSNGANGYMPSDSFQDLVLGASGTTYIAPANGCFRLVKKPTATNQYIQLSPHKYYNDTVNSDSGALSFSHDTNTPCVVSLPVLFGDKVRCYYNMGGDVIKWEFRYAEGSV